MRTSFLIAAILLFGCNNSTQQPTTIPPTVKLNSDSLKHIAADTKQHFEFVKKIFEQLDIDSLNANDGESYRFIMSNHWPSSQMGNPISITFHKNADSCYVVIKEIWDGNNPVVSKKVRFIPATSFDSISQMFDTYFWNHEITDYNCDKLNIDGGTKFYEAFKNGKHKLISQRNCGDAKLVKGAYYNFIFFSNYSDAIIKDWIWFKNNPPGHVKTPGPPSSIKSK